MGRRFVVGDIHGAHKALIKDSDGISSIQDTNREGFVFRKHDDSSVSFKVISNKFLLKNED